MIRSFFRKLSDCSSWIANLLMSPKEIPLKLLFLMNSYRLMLSVSKVMHRWLRK